MECPIKVSVCSGCGAGGKILKVRYPDRYLCSKCRKIDQDQKRKQTPIQDPQEARRNYELYRSHSRFADILPDYDTLRDKFKSDLSLKEIGRQYGISKQRIDQIYKRFFSLHIPYQPDGNARRKIHYRRKRESKNLAKLARLEMVFSGDPGMSALKEKAESLGLKVQAISVKGLGGRIILIGGKHCVVYLTRYSHHPRTSAKNIYWGFSLNPVALKLSEFVILVVVESDRYRFFIVPTHKFPSKFFGIKSVALYVPQKRIDHDCRTGRKSAIDIHQYENQWGFLVGQNFQYKKTASTFRVPSVPPSGLT